MGRCSYGDVTNGVCREQTCIAVLCGNGLVDPDEVCDDGNTIPGDGCSSDCQLRCGDGKLDDGELCDSGAPPGQDCVDYNYDLGALRCSSDCQRATFGGCQSFSWTPMPAPSNWHLTDIWAFDLNDVYAVGLIADDVYDGVACLTRPDCGTIFHFNGDEWAQLASPSDIPLLVGLWGTKSGELFAVGVMGTVIHYDGSAWQTMNTGIDLDTHLARVWGTGKENIFAVGANINLTERTSRPEIFHFDGTNWRRMTIPGLVDFPDNTYSMGIGGTSPDNVYASGTDDLILHYDGNDELLWSRIQYQSSNESNFLALAGAPFGDVVIAGDDGVSKIFRQGAPMDLSTGIRSTITDIEYAGGGNWYASSLHGHLLRFNGQSEPPWLIENSPQQAQLTSLSSINEQIVFAAGAAGALLLRSGTDWKRIDLPDSTGRIHHRYIDNEGCIYLATGNGEVYISGKHRENWSRLPGPSGRSIWGEDCGETIYIATYGDLAHFDGTDWTQYKLPGNSAARDIVQLDDDTLVVAGHEDLLATVHIDGPVPQIRSLDFPYADGHRFQAVWASPSGTLFVGGRGGVVFSFDGYEWKVEMPRENGAATHGIWGVSDTHVFAVGTGGVFEFNGDTWRRMETPSTIGEVHDIWGVAPDKIFIGGSGGLLGFYDGENWSRVRSPTTATISAVWASDWPGELFIGTELGEVYSTTQFSP